MKPLATTLLILGTIIGTFGGARLPQAHPLIATLGLAMLATACLIVYRGHRQTRAAPAARAGETAVFDLIRALPEKLQGILDDTEELSLEQIGDRLGALEQDYFRLIADASPALLSRLGAETFASIFGLYAGGERLVARAWSASVDHHRPETIACLREGMTRIRQAVAAIPSPR